MYQLVESLFIYIRSTENVEERRFIHPKFSKSNTTDETLNIGIMIGFF